MNLRLRLFLLVVVTALPTFALLLWNQAELTAARYDEVRRQVLVLAQQQASEINQIAEGALQFLVALGEIPVIRAGIAAECAGLLSNIRDNYKAYRALIRADLHGNIVCSSIGPGPGIADRDYFIRALRTGTFAVGEYTVGRGTRSASIHFSYPIRTRHGEITGIIAAALDLEWLHERMSERIQGDTALTVTDRNKTILLRVPHNDKFRGQKVPDEYSSVMNAAMPGVMEVRGLDGNRQLLGYVPIAASRLNLHVGVAKDIGAAFADVTSAQIRGAAVSTSGLALALLLAWLVAELGIAKPVREVLGEVERWKAGRETRTDRRWPRSELGRLGEAFEDFATTLSQRERDLRASQEKLAAREAYLSFVLDRIPAGIAQTNGDMAYVFVNQGMCQILARDKSDIIGHTFLEVTHPDDVERDAARFQEALKARQPYVHRKRYLRPDGSVVWTENTVTHLEGSDGILAVCLLLDERMKAEERQQRLINELNHRVKNTLATVQALMMVSRRSSESADDLVASFAARLKALSVSHDLLTGTLWEEAPLRELVDAELSLYGRNKVNAEGSDVKLNPRETIGLGMILHELATNALKYGAFARTEGAVSITWREDKGRLFLWWEETNGAVTKSDRVGFGTRLIQQTAADLGGSATYDAGPTGLRWEIIIGRKPRQAG